MMRYRMVSILVLLVLLTALATPAVNAAPVVRHSGTVAAIDLDNGVLIVEEVGPWRVEGGATVVTRRAISLTPATKYNLFMRVAAPGAFAGDFVEVMFDVNDVAPGDFVTVECAHADGRLVALTVTVAELP
jgi:predicted S18 family serine protease